MADMLPMHDAQSMNTDPRSESEPQKEDRELVDVHLTGDDMDISHVGVITGQAHAGVASHHVDQGSTQGQTAENFNNSAFQPVTGLTQEDIRTLSTHPFEELLQKYGDKQDDDDMAETKMQDEEAQSENPQEVQQKQEERNYDKGLTDKVDPRVC